MTHKPRAERLADDDTPQELRGRRWHGKESEEGVVSIPAYMAGPRTSSLMRRSPRDLFTKAMLKEGTYTSGQLDKEWIQEITDHFRGWLKENKNDRPVPADRVQEIINGIEWREGRRQSPARVVGVPSPPIEKMVKPSVSSWACRHLYGPCRRGT